MFAFKFVPQDGGAGCAMKFHAGHAGGRWKAGHPDLRRSVAFLADVNGAEGRSRALNLGDAVLIISKAPLLLVSKQAANLLHAVNFFPVQCVGVESLTADGHTKGEFEGGEAIFQHAMVV